VKRLRYENGDLDATDVRILDALVNDARISTADLARSVGLSPPSVSERIKRLEEAGVIEGYTLTINPKALGLPIAAWLRIRPIPGQLQKVADILRGLRETGVSRSQRFQGASQSYSSPGSSAAGCQDYLGYSVLPRSGSGRRRRRD